ncbi:MAG TPA: glycosidase [Syntrophomonadaceae bacterium]|nr:glycosidase [Syntrophomonadaceae bacterium]
MPQVMLESLFDQAIEEWEPLLKEYSDYDLVIGIPFNKENRNLTALLTSMDEVLGSWIGRRQLIISVGDGDARELLNEIKNLNLKHPQIAFQLPAEISGRGMNIRAIIEVTKRVDAELLLFSPSMATSEGPGIDSNWLDNLLTPIQGKYDLVVGSLRRYLATDSITQIMAAPILEAFYGARVSDPLGGIYAISHDFIEELAHEAKFWGNTIQGYGIDFWILTRALVWNKNICEVNMGGIINPHKLEKRNKIFYENAITIFEAIKRDWATWLQDRLVVRVADISIRSEIKEPDPTNYSADELINNFRKGIGENQAIVDSLSCKDELKALSLVTDDFYLSDELWVSAFLELVMHYSFVPEFSQREILGLLTALYNGRVASYVIKRHEFAEDLATCSNEEKDELIVRKLEGVKHRLTNQFWAQKGSFNDKWLEKREQVKPPIIPLGYMEYVPGKPIVVPKKITGKDQHIVNTDDIFKELRKRYEDKFNEFTVQDLKLASNAQPQEVVNAVEGFMVRLESALGKIFPGDLNNVQGVEEFVAKLFKVFPTPKMYTINSDLLREMLIRFPPVNLMIPLGYYKPADLIQEMDPRDAVTYANIMESWSYTDRDLIWLVDNLKPESFAWVDIKPLILNDDMSAGGNLSQGKTSSFNRITGRIIIKPLSSGKGGKYPRLRYFTDIVRRIALAEDYSELFLDIASKRKNINAKIKNSLLGIRKGDDFSAHNIFENYHHRRLVEKIRFLADHLAQAGDQETAHLLELMADGYGLSQVLEDGTFLTCTAWSFASYSFKGGLKIPSPFTTSVENRWFNHDFLESLYTSLGYDKGEIKQLVLRLITDGKSGHNLLDSLLPTRPKDVAVVVQETTDEPSKFLTRYEGNPILEPLEGSNWESRYVLNPGSLRIKDKVYLFYRAVGEDNISHIGLAITDGYEVTERLAQPILSPATPEERMGCEDARVMIIDDKLYMVYTAYDGNIAQIAVASTGLEEFSQGNYSNWKREGLAFTNIWNKDAIILPEKIKGKYVVYHRIEPSMWVTYTDELKFPIREKHAIILGPRPGRMWDSLKIGAGAQAIKTKYGWLQIYHGVDHNYVYRLGVLLFDLNNPSKVIYRSPNPILEPEEDYEIGMSGAWVPNVVFTCGAVPAEDKEVLEDDDEILVYYGAADTSIGMAKAKLAELIPEPFRKAHL